MSYRPVFTSRIDFLQEIISNFLRKKKTYVATKLTSIIFPVNCPDLYLLHYVIAKNCKC